ncbi:MAG TPA: hypothetical protein VNZ45_11530, partial [Bacteroidia bacterium]|nr:hypothetical protein [Bacteroidia bacterium]
MFGSESGNATHYKKNIVIDPNGQASVSYLDQEGRTIATCLAGNPGVDSTGNYTLTPLPSQSGASAYLNVDLLAADANGHSDNNEVNVDGNSIVFNSQIAVGYTSSYRFHYSLQIDTLSTPCLRNICLHCVYSLNIKVTNDCGQVMTSSSGETDPIHKTVGNFTLSHDTVVFTTACTYGPSYTDTDGFVLNLTPGNYTVSKILTVDSAALNFYTKQYLDSANDACFKTLADFEQAAMAKEDTCNCHITCQTCIASLGSRDAFVANGKGTAMQYDFLYDQCARPCKPTTPCDEKYQQMLGDMSPGGQYGQFIDSTNGNIDPSIYRLSVYNNGNVLPVNRVTNNGNWHYPVVALNNHKYPYYVDNYGNRTIVNLTPTSYGGFRPQVIDSTDTVNWLRHDLKTGVYYTYPENLKYFSDFKQFWQASWAQSLIMYHPEYVYDTICMQFEALQSGDTMTSETFDERMQKAKTFADAESAGFIIASKLTGSVIPSQRVAYFFSVNPHMYDPFLVDARFKSDVIDSTHFNIDGSFRNTFNNYFKLNGSTTLDMVSTAAMTARCGTYFGTAGFDTACTHFGTPFSGNVTIDDSIYNKEWIQFKNYYLSAKQALQFQMMNYAALNVAKEYCGCIGDKSFNPCASGMCGSWPHSEGFNPNEPCSMATISQYIGKQRRFLDPATENESVNDANYQYYEQSGQCPIAGELQGFLSSLFSGKKLKDATDTLNSNPAFTLDLYKALRANSPPAIPIQMQWSFQDTVGSTTLQGNITDLSARVYCSITLDKTGSGITYWNQIISLQDIAYTGPSGGEDGFSIKAVVLNSPDSLQPFLYKTITGSSCIAIHGCQFSADCNPNQLAIDLGNLMSALAASGNLAPSSPISLETYPYLPLLTTAIINTLGTPNTHLTWAFIGHNEFDLYDNTDPSSKKIALFINSYTPNTFTYTSLSTLTSIDSITSAGANLFTMQGLNGSPVVSINATALLDSVGGSRPLSMGSCELPANGACQGVAYENEPILDSMITYVLLQKPFKSDINIVNSPFFTQQLATYMPGTLDSTSSKEDSVTTGGIYYDTLTFKYYVTDSLIRGQGTAHLDNSGACQFYITHKDYSGHLKFTDLVSISNFMGTGQIDQNGYYEDFTCIATYHHSSSYYTDTLYGHSCIPILNCQSCESPNQAALTYVPLSIVPGKQYAFNTPPATPIVLTASSCTSIALGPNLVYDGDFETVPAFAYDAPHCYQVRSPLYHARPAESNTKFYPTLSAMRFDSCNFRTFFYMSDMDYADIYEITDALPSILKQGVAHSGSHMMIVAPPSVGCAECSLTNPAALLYTPNYSAVAWQQTIPTIKGTSYQFSFWLKNIDSLFGTTANLATVSILINDTTRFSVIDTNAKYKFWKKNSFCWTATCDSALIQITGTANTSTTTGCDFALDDISFNPVLVSCPHPPDTAISPLTAKVGNPCIQQLENNATLNATTSYNQYMDSLITDFRTRYMNHCLKAAEGLNMLYTDKQYHYTLYYYDQAGNLVRTAPPQGVQLLSITSYTDALEEQIIGDRTLNHHTVFTNHLLTSGYVYNSLNQLVKQTVPDDDNMAMWQYTLPNGLDASMTLTGTQFVDASNGYLSGYDILLSGLHRGLLYKTHDAGHTWQAMKATIGVGLNKVQMLTNTNNGFAVGNGGMLVATADAGNSWDIIPLFTRSITQNLNDLAFDSADNVMAVVGTGVSFSIKANTYGYYASTGMSAAENMTGVTWDKTNSKFYAVGDSSGYGVFYTGSVASNIITWTKLYNNLSALPIYKVQFLPTNASHGVAAGLNGAVMHTTDRGAHWYAMHTYTNKLIRNIYFITDSIGVALIDSIPQYCQIYKTSNGGRTWGLISTPGEYYYDMSWYYDPAATEHAYKGLAVGYKGAITRIVTSTALPSPYFGLIEENRPSSYDLRAIAALPASNGGLNAVAAGKGNYIYYTTNANNAFITWDSVNTLGRFLKAAMILNKHGNMMPVFLTSKHELYSLKTNNLIPAGYTVDSTTYSSTSGYTDLLQVGLDSAVMTFRSGQLRVLDSNSSVPATELAAPTTLSGSTGSTYSTLGFAGIGKMAGADSATETINTASISGSAATFLDVSHHTHALRLWDVDAENDYVYATGDDGTIISQASVSGSPVLKTLQSRTKKTLYSIGIDKYSGNQSIIAGDSGALYNLGWSGLSTAFSFGYFNAIPGPVLQRFYHVALSYNTGYAYVVGAQGTGFLISRVFSFPSASPTSNPGSYIDLHGVSFLNNGPAIAVGTNTTIMMMGGTSATAITSVYNPGFNALHFMDVNHGYAVGDSGTIRRTDDAGAHWQLVTPEKNSHGVPNFMSVWTTSAGNAILTGSGSFLGQAYPDNLVTSATGHSYEGTSGTTWYKVRFNANYLGSGYAVGSSDSVLNLTVTGGALASYSSMPTITLGSSNLHSVWVFRDNTLMVTGTNGKAYYYNGSTWTDYSPSTQIPSRYANFTWNDITFRDDVTGWMVGDSTGNASGEIVKAIGSTTIQTLGSFPWLAQTVRDGLNAHSIVTNANQVNYNTIA